MEEGEDVEIGFEEDKLFMKNHKMMIEETKKAKIDCPEPIKAAPLD